MSKPPIVSITPAKTHPIPFDLDDDPQPNLMEQMLVAGNTAELQVSLGATLNTPDMLENVSRNTRRLFEEVPYREPKEAAEARKRVALSDLPTALAAASFLREYGKKVAYDVATLRSAITNKLMEIADCGNPKYELRALELLGKHSDIGLFTERSEVTVNYKTPEDLETAIKERVRRLLHANLIDVTPTVTPDMYTLDEELEVLHASDAGTEETLSDTRWGGRNGVVEGKAEDEDDDDGDWDDGADTR